MTDLNKYFSLGLTNEDDPIEDDIVMNTIRTPPNTKSASFNRVIFEIPKVGLLTKDSGIMVQPKVSATSQNASSNIALNMVNGVLACVKRCTLNIDGKELTNIENPSILETNRLYSRNSPARMFDYQNVVLGSAFSIVNLSEDFKTASHEGVEILDSQQSTVRHTKGDTFVAKNNLSGSASLNANNKYMVPLHMLGMSFLRHQKLPVHLMKNRDIVLEIEFDSDCRNWAFNGTGTPLVATDCDINLDSCELVTTHVQQNEELEQILYDELKESSRVYDLMETYLIKQSMVNNVVGTKTNSLVRLNLQNRELQKILQCQVPVAGDGSNPVANQVSESLGDVELNHRSNGVFIFDRRVSNNAQQFYLNSNYNEERGLKVSNNAWSQTAHQTNGQLVSTNKDFTSYCGRWNYIGVNYRNGNDGVFGAGTTMRTPLEIHYDSTAAKTSNPNQVGEKDLNFYVSVSKRLVISQNAVQMTF
jgi:hypothetical protein